MTTSSIMANFATINPEAARAFATAFVRNARKSNMSVVMLLKMITRTDLVRKGA